MKITNSQWCSETGRLSRYQTTWEILQPLVLLLAIFCFFFAATRLCLWLQEYQQWQTECPVSLSDGSPGIGKLKKAMKYHGIDYAYQQGGKWLFERDGKTIKLFRKE